MAGSGTDGFMECGIWVTVALSSHYQSVPMCDWGLWLEPTSGWALGFFWHAFKGCLRAGLDSWLKQTCDTVLLYSKLVTFWKGKLPFAFKKH